MKVAAPGLVVKSTIRAVDGVRVSLHLDSAVQAAGLGEEWAWRRLYEWVTPKLLGYVSARGARDPEEAVGEVWLQVARNIGSFEGSAAQFRSWVFMVAHHRVIDQARHGRIRTEAAPPPIRAFEPSAEDLAIAAHQIAEIASILDDFPFLERSVILLRIVADLSVVETAEVLNRTPSAVKSAQYRGLGRLRKKLELLATNRHPHPVTRSI